MIRQIFVEGKGMAFIDINDLHSSRHEPLFIFQRDFFGKQIKSLFLGESHRDDILVWAVAVIVVTAVAFGYGITFIAGKFGLLREWDRGLAERAGG